MISTKFIHDAPKTKEKLLNLLLCCVFFFIPIQAAPANIFGMLALIIFILTPESLSKVVNAIKSPLSIAFITFFFINLLSLAWTENQEVGINYIQHYLLYAFFPVFVAMMKREFIPYMFSAFLLGMLFSETLSYGLWLDLWHISGANNDYTPFVHHMIYSPIAAFSAFLLTTQLINHWSNFTKLKRVSYLFFIFTLSLNIFFTHGRAGMIALLVLMLTLATIRFYKKPLKLIATTGKA